MSENTKEGDLRKSLNGMNLQCLDVVERSLLIS
jgi:hypothetical protein